MTDEVERQEGVEPAEGTAATEQAGVPEKPATPTAPEPKAKPVNLDEIEEFRKYKSEEQKRAAQMQAEIAETRRLLQEQQGREQYRQQREFQQRIEAAPDDYSRLQVQREYEAQVAQMLAQQNQYLSAQLGQVTLGQQIERDKQARIAEMRERMQRDYGIDIPEGNLQDATDLGDLGAKALKYIEGQIAVKAKKDKDATRQRDGVDDVDVGAGAPRSPDADEKRAWEQATRGNNLTDAVTLKFQRASKQK